MATTITSTAAPARSHCSVRTSDLTTKRAAARAFVAHSSPRVIAAVTAAALAARLLVGSWSLADFAVVVVTIALVGPVEWVIHRFLLHAADDSFAMRRLGTGHGHRQHHLDPSDIHWLLLRGVDAAVYSAGIAVFTAMWTVPLLVVAGSGVGWPVLAPYLTALVVAFLALGHYEWTHLLVHTRYRPRTRLYTRLARHHRFHHFRNERYWLGVTSNVGDRLLGTLPADRTSVPLSDTARTLS